MARIRSLKIGFFQNETLAELSFAHRLLFEGLWLIADREGRLEDRPKRIKGQIFPYDDGLNVDAMLTDLAAGADPFIVRYEVNGQRYIQVAGFVTHQRPHHTEPASVYPTVDQGVATTPDKTGGAPDSHRPVSRPVLAEWWDLQRPARLVTSQNNSGSPRCGMTWSTSSASTCLPSARQSTQRGLWARNGVRRLLRHARP